MPNPTTSHVSNSDKAENFKRSQGGLYLAVGFLILILGGFVASMPGGFWPIFFVSFAFNVVGFLVARGRVRRLIAVGLCGLSGGLFAQDFLIWLAQR